MEKIFLKEFGCFGYKKEVIMTVSNPKEFLKMQTLETLKLLLEKQLETENFETAGLIQEEINKRKNEKEDIT